MMEISNEQLQRLATGTITPGDVYRMELTTKEGVKPKNEGDTSRNKYFIVMGVTEDGYLIGFVLINSEINQNISARARESHYKILAADYPFLEKDRYVCCGELKEIHTSDFFQRFKQGIVGTIRPDHLDVIRGIIAMSANVSAGVLKSYGII